MTTGSDPQELPPPALIENNCCSIDFNSITHEPTLCYQPLKLIGDATAISSTASSNAGRFGGDAKNVYYRIRL
jgi:hypothetical protein